MTDTEFNTLLDEVISSLEEKGYEPYEQIYGYVQTGNETYITRHGNAREKIKLLDNSKLKAIVYSKVKGASCIIKSVDVEN